LPEHEPTQLILRHFVEADEDEVTSWFEDAGQLRHFAGPRLTWPLDAAQWCSVRLDPNVTAWTGVLGDDPTPIGHGELVVESPSVIRLACLAVTPRNRGYGVGRAMVANLIAKSRAGGHALLTLDVHRDNTSAIRAYRSLGFAPTADPLPHGNVRMELELG
jgi:ribosomal protein S18 acetylase RimI-like enzyme